MSFIWSQMLSLLLPVVLAIVGYVVLARRRAALRATTGFLGTAGAGARRHVPIALFLVATTILTAGLARPEVVLDVPRYEGTVVLLFDTSTSMLAEDVTPSRLDGAKDVARSFVESGSSGVRFGVVSFSSGGSVLQPPTSESGDVLAAIDRVDADGATSLGQGIFTALNALDEDPITLDLAGGEGADAGADAFDPTTVDIGYFGSAIVVLFTDGENTADPDPLDLAVVASNAGVQIYPVGLGTEDGAVLDVDGFSVSTVLDTDLLTEIAQITEGEYIAGPTDADELDISGLADALDRELTVRGEPTEVTGLVALIGGVLLLAGAALSMRWFGRAP